MMLSPHTANLALAFNPKKNSLGFLRFFLAILVVLQHSYHLANFGRDPLFILSNHSITAGALAVHSFLLLVVF
ncbi:hypothetical protein JYQ62_25945 [Nostoc sp. UHCC 0702]|nr:hypothetical protein JYQ62_25945 [Nostoc sp. UHCC 0702]